MLPHHLLGDGWHVGPRVAIDPSMELLVHGLLVGRAARFLAAVLDRYRCVDVAVVGDLILRTLRKELGRIGDRDVVEADLLALRVGTERLGLGAACRRERFARNEFLTRPTCEVEIDVFQQKDKAVCGQAPRGIGDAVILELCRARLGESLCLLTSLQHDALCRSPLCSRTVDS